MSLYSNHKSSCLSNIREMLTHLGDVALYRQIFILAGEEVWQKKILQDILLEHEKDSLWVGENAPEVFPSIPFNKAKLWLGNEKFFVIFDANKNFDVDSFAAISGIVLGGGGFFLLFPEEEKWNNIYSSCFGKRLLQSINDLSELTLIKQNNESFKFFYSQPELNEIEDCSSPFLSDDQQYVVETIEKNALEDKNTPIVLISDRGRGKSAALGITAARLVSTGIKKIAITAPRLRAVDTIFKHISELLPNAVITRGRISIDDSVIQFYSPDQIMNENIKSDVLLVDEAAAIPIPLLTTFLNRFPQCIFATTVHGYEGTGRGFSLRFFDVLDKYNENWIKLLMEKPIRWAENDPLENWMFDLLCLDAELVDDEHISNIIVGKIEYRLVEKNELINNQVLLKDIFSLLVLAHYRTRPKDLKNLLDDERISVYVAFYDKYAVAVSLVIKEGHFSSSLSSDVYRGERRPSGHLLAQTLTYHCGIENAAIFNYSRIMRIAVHPSIQHKGIGTALVEVIIHHAKENGADAIGASFGMTKGLLNFWQLLKFKTVRIGFTQEQSSGEHAAVMLLPLSPNGENISQEASVRFSGQLPYWFDDILKNIPLEIMSLFKKGKVDNSSLTDFEKADLQSYIKYSRNYELCIAALNKLVLIKSEEINCKDFPEIFRDLIIKKVRNKADWKDIAKEMALSGKNEARQAFHEAIVYLYDDTP